MAKRPETVLIEKALTERYFMPEWLLLFNVLCGAGVYQGRRYADALAFNLFPTRGLQVIGFEIKATRGDLLGELKNPAKAEEIGRYCDEWYVAAPKGLCRPDELPVTWGLIELLPGGGLRIAKKASKLKAKPLDRLFVAAIARRIGERDIAIRRLQGEEIIDAARAEAKKIKDEAALAGVNTRFLDEFKALKERVELFKQTTGIDLMDAYNVQRIGEAVNLIENAGLAGSYKRIETIMENLINWHKTLGDAASGLKALMQPKTKKGT